MLILEASYPVELSYSNTYLYSIPRLSRPNPSENLLLKSAIIPVFKPITKGGLLANLKIFYFSGSSTMVIY